MQQFCPAIGRIAVQGPFKILNVALGRIGKAFPIATTAIAITTQHPNAICFLKPINVLDLNPTCCTSRFHFVVHAIISGVFTRPVCCPQLLTGTVVIKTTHIHPNITQLSLCPLAYTGNWNKPRTRHIVLHIRQHHIDLTGLVLLRAQMLAIREHARCITLSRHHNHQDNRHRKQQLKQSKTCL